MDDGRKNYKNSPNLSGISFSLESNRIESNRDEFVKLIILNSTK